MKDIIKNNSWYIIIVHIRVFNGNIYSNQLEFIKI